ncbi:hypothetical protein HA466_0197250 [Hirschfeldia incana]|nr:hypothetical protein HA466_0197250 [Hirschfeldia incana]
MKNSGRYFFWRQRQHRKTSFFLTPRFCFPFHLINDKEIYDQISVAAAGFRVDQKNRALVSRTRVENMFVKLHEQDGSTNTEPTVMKLTLGCGNGLQTLNQVVYLEVFVR